MLSRTGIYFLSVQLPRRNNMDIRTGFGYDIHRLKEEKDSFFLLSQVKIMSSCSIIAHSDGDILLHSLSNAILSSIGKEDIGYYFPDNKNETENISSLDILNFSLSEMKKEGYHLSNVVVDIVLEKPKLKPYRKMIKEQLSKYLNIDISRIGLSCNTHEGVDSIGKSESIVVFTQVLVIKD